MRELEGAVGVCKLGWDGVEEEEGLHRDINANAIHTQDSTNRIGEVLRFDSI